ncbi:MAG TPA: DUF192 domain-containing protein [Bryobacteraceae bacterium]|nr:DUF192 domain-containing protein [Bryobacteraceae bacterium]
MWLKTFWVYLVLFLLAGCTSGRKTATLDDLYTREVRFPDGAIYRAEVATKPYDMTRGLMFRESLAADRGMLFIYGSVGEGYKVWTYNNRFPVDAIWLDQNRLITEIVPAIAPCKSESANGCPFFGGSTRSLYVLELNAGVAAKHNLKPGDRLSF